MNNILVKIKGESEGECLYRIGSAKNDGMLDMTWQQIADWMNEEFRESETEYRTESAYRKKFRAYSDTKKQQPEKNGAVDEYIYKMRELKKERIKLSTEKLEYNKWLREESRDELIMDNIISAIKQLPVLNIPDKINITNNSRSAILGFGDEHFGSQFTIFGLFGEIINQYDPTIFEQRMWELLYKTIDIVNKESITTLYVFALGDFTDGILRCGQLMKLKYGVVEGTVMYANFISTWLNELSKYVNIKYQMTFGNHSELRMLGQPKGTFKNDNTGLFVREMIKVRLENNPNFEMIINPTGLIFDNIEGFNVLGIHGEVKNMENAIKDFSNTYKTNIDILIGGHMHHYKAEATGVGREVINVPSLIGIDDFAMSLNKTSNPGAMLLIVEKNTGISIEYKIKL